MRCNGCGGTFQETFLEGVLSWGRPVVQKGVTARYHKTLCPRCQHVMKDILMSSDLSDHWHKYDWEAMNGRYTEIYDES